jgi:hypothetical protein
LKNKYYIFLLLFLLFLFNNNNLIADSYKNKNIKSLVSLVNGASKLVQIEEENAFKKFKEYKSNWFNKNDFILVFDLNGNCIVNNDILKKEIVIMNGRVVSQEEFRKWLLFETKISNEKEGFVYYLSKESDNILPVWKTLFFKIVKTSSSEYIIATFKGNVKLEEQLVLKELDEISGLLNLKGFMSFPVIRRKVSNFFGEENFLFIIDEEGNVIFNTGTKKNFRKENILDSQDSLNNYFIKDIIKFSKINNNGKIIYYCPKIDPTLAYARHIYFKTQMFENKKIIICYSVLFDDAICFNIEKNKNDIFEVKYLTKKISDEIQKIGFDNFKTKLKNKEINFINDDTKNAFFVIDFNNQKIILDSVNLDEEDKYIKNLRSSNEKSIWKNINLILDNNNNRGWLNFSIDNDKDEFSVFKKWQWYFVYLNKVNIDNNFYVICVVSNINKVEKEFLEENNKIVKSIVTKSLKDGKISKDVKDILNSLVINNTRLFFVDMFGIQIFDSEFFYIDNTNILKMKDADGNFIVKNYLNLMKKNSNHSWMEYNFKNTNGNFERKSLYLDKIEENDKFYVIGTEADFIES